MDEKQFRQTLSDEGFPDPVQVTWEAGKDNPNHAHDFYARGLVLSGEMTLGTADEVRHLKTGDNFSMRAGIPHWEKVGDAPVDLLVSRK